MRFVLSIFREVRDPRDINARHDLAELLFLALAATLCGAKSCVEIAEFVEGREEELKEIVSLGHGCPSHDTFSRIFRLLDPEELSRAFTAFLAALRQSLGLPQRPGGVVAIDGKALRRGYDKGRAFMPPMMVSVVGRRNQAVDRCPAGRGFRRGRRRPRSAQEPRPQGLHGDGRRAALPARHGQGADRQEGPLRPRPEGQSRPALRLRRDKLCRLPATSPSTRPATAPMAAPRCAGRASCRSRRSTSRPPSPG